MKLKHLNYFLSLCENKSFTDTSEKLGISQSYLSTHIRELEHELKAELLIRNHGDNHLTKEGFVVKKEAKLSLTNWNRLLMRLNCWSILEKQLKSELALI